MDHRRVTAAALLLLAAAGPVAAAAAPPAGKKARAKARAEATVAPPEGLRLYGDANFLLPAGARVSTRWVLPPTEKGHLSSRLAVRPDGSPVIAAGERLLAPTRGWAVSLGREPAAITFGPRGVLLLASGNDVGLLAEPEGEARGENGLPLAAFQPLFSPPLRSITAMATAGDELLVAGWDEPAKRHAVYRLRSVKGVGLQDLERIHESAEPIAAVAGDDASLYVAAGRRVTRIARREGAATALYVHPTDPVEELALTGAGVVVSTGKELVLVSPRGALAMLRSGGHRIAAQGGTLHILFTRSLGVLALAGLDDLARFDLAARSLRPGERAPAIALAAPRFFESGPPPYGAPSYAEQFDRKAVRSIVARLDFTAPPGKAERRHVVTLTWFEPTGGQLASTSVTVTVPAGGASGTIDAAIGGGSGEGYLPRHQLAGSVRWRFGNDPLGTRYPGRYRLELAVDGVPAGGGGFTLAGEPRPSEVIAYDDLPALQRLLAGGLPAGTRIGETPLLHFAVRIGTARAVDALLAAGASPDDLDETGSTALRVATLGVAEWRAKAESLVRRGANVNARLGKERNPLVHAPWQPEHVAFLLRNGADPRARSASSGESLLSKATSPGMCTEELLTELLTRGASLDSPDEPLPHHTPLGSAIFYGDDACVGLLLSRGASQRAASREDRDHPRTALYMALERLKRRPDAAGRRIVERLLAAGGALAPDETWIMFDGGNTSFFDATTLGIALLTDDAALEKASRSADPEVRVMALRAHAARAREETEAATSEFQLAQAHDHCAAAFRLAEAGYRRLEVEAVPAGQPRPALGLALLARPERGVWVHAATAGGPAAAAGLAPGDVLLAVDGGDVNAPLDVAAALARAEPGRQVRLTVLRDTPPQLPELPLLCGLLEQRIGKRELAQMHLGRWLAENPAAPQAAEVREMLERR